MKDKKDKKTRLTEQKDNGILKEQSKKITKYQTPERISRVKSSYVPHKFIVARIVNFCNCYFSCSPIISMDRRNLIA